MATTNFLQWNPNANNQESDGQYTADSQRSNGATEGVFPSPTANKLFYQTSTMAAALANMLVAKGITTSDANFSNLVTALSVLAVAGDIQNNVFTYALDTGVVNAYAVTPSPSITAYTTGLAVWVKAISANTGASTLNVSGLGAKSWKFPDGSALPAGTIVVGGVYLAVYDGTKFQLVSISTQNLYPGRLLNIRVFNTPGYSAAYVPTTGTLKIVVELVGGGGGGAGSAGQGASGLAFGSGGGGGGYAASYLTTFADFNGKTITVGAGGATSGSGGAGNAGTSSSFAATVPLSATGGGGGQTATGSNNVPFIQGGGGGGTGVGGNLVNSNGASGATSVGINNGSIVAGDGGRSMLGMGAVEHQTGSPGNGTAATAPGGGGSGGLTLNNGAATTGGAGAAGMVIIYEYM